MPPAAFFIKMLQSILQVMLALSCPIYKELRPGHPPQEPGIWRPTGLTSGSWGPLGSRLGTPLPSTAHPQPGCTLREGQKGKSLGSFTFGEQKIPKSCSSSDSVGAISPPKSASWQGNRSHRRQAQLTAPQSPMSPPDPWDCTGLCSPPPAHQSPDLCTKSPPVSSRTGAGDTQPSSPRCGAAHSPHNRPPLSMDALTHQSLPHSAVAAGLLLPSSFPKQQGRPAGLTSPQRRGHGSEAAAAVHGVGWEAEGPQLGVGTLGTHPVHRPDAPSPPAVTQPCFPALIPLGICKETGTDTRDWW